MKGLWFYTDNYMEDGVTRIAICAQSDAQAEAFRKKGWHTVESSSHVGVPEKTPERNKEKPMKENKAVEKVVARMYKDRLKKTGRLPGGVEVREMETKVKQAAENADKHKGRR